MKKIFTGVVFLLAAALGVFVYFNSKKIAAEPQAEVTFEQSVVAAGLEFTLPDGWKVADRQDATIWFSVPNSNTNHDVLLPVNITKETAERDALSPFITIPQYTLPNGAQISQGGCAPGTCFYIVYNNEVYMVGFGFSKIDGVLTNPYEGSQIPGLPDGWSKEEMENFLQTVR